MDPQLARLREHRVPAWYEDAKLGIFIHWSLFSVPAWAPRVGTITDALRDRYDDFVPHSPYADWYENALKFPDSPTARHHREAHAGRPYADFREPFVAALEQWDPDAWAARFAAAGARYVVLVSKHHDGFCLWPTAVPNPHRAGWHTERDVVGDLARAVRARGLRFGVYYSGGIDWTFAPEPVRNLGDMIASIPITPEYRRYARAQVEELVDRYQPDVLWNDIAWPGRTRDVHEVMASYYDRVPEGVVNDRWLPGVPFARIVRPRPVRALLNRLLARSIRKRGFAPPPPPPHCDFRTPEYTSFDTIQKRKWESTRGLGNSFCWNRNEDPAAVPSVAELVASLSDIVAKNGNLLLNVGPRGEDASLPEDQLERLAGLGEWLGRSGEAIHGTRPAERAEGRTRDGAPVRFTRSGSTRYVILPGEPAGEEIFLPDPGGDPEAPVRMLGHGPVPVHRDAGYARVSWPAGAPRRHGAAWAFGA